MDFRRRPRVHVRRRNSGRRFFLRHDFGRRNSRSLPIDSPHARGTASFDHRAFHEQTRDHREIISSFAKRVKPDQTRSGTPANWVKRKNRASQLFIGAAIADRSAAINLRKRGEEKVTLLPLSLSLSLISLWALWMITSSLRNVPSINQRRSAW